MVCKFCEIGTGVFGNELDRPICESDDYYAVSSLGGFVPGWTLIFPKKHALNMSSDYGSSSFREFVHKVTTMVAREYGPCVHFEHGAAVVNSLTGCGVNHAHLHIVPSSKSIEALSVTSRPSFGWQRIETVHLESKTRGAEYLFCSDAFEGNPSTGLLALLPESESQFFRKLIAASFGLNGLYDYKRHRFEELALSTATHLRSCFSEIY